MSLHSGTPIAITQKHICVPLSNHIHWKVELKSFPMVYGMPILHNNIANENIAICVPQSGLLWACLTLHLPCIIRSTIHVPPNSVYKGILFYPAYEVIPGDENFLTIHRTTIVINMLTILNCQMDCFRIYYFMNCYDENNIYFQSENAGGASTLRLFFLPTI